MGCRELQITDYFRLTPSTGTPNTSIYNSPDTSKKPPRGFKPVVSVSTSNYRYYIPSLGRWTKRDPIAERGGKNLYGFVDNDAVSYIDIYGNMKSSDHVEDKILDMIGKELVTTTEKSFKSKPQSIHSGYFYSIDSNDNCCYEYKTYADWIQIKTIVTEHYTATIRRKRDYGPTIEAEMLDAMVSFEPVDLARSGGSAPFLMSKSGVVEATFGIAVKGNRALSDWAANEIEWGTLTWKQDKKDYETSYRRVSIYRIGKKRRQVAMSKCEKGAAIGKPIKPDFRRYIWRYKGLLLPPYSAMYDDLFVPEDDYEQMYREIQLEEMQRKRR